MSIDEIQPRLTPIFRDVLDDDELVVTPELSASDVDNWDSLSHLSLIVSIERTFGIKFAASEMASMKNVGDLITLIHKKTL